MKADVQYNDFTGTAAADISDMISTNYGGDTLDSFANFFKLDKERFKIIGISFYGTRKFSISLLCVDLELSTDEKEHIVSMMMDWDQERSPLDILFKRLDIVLHQKYDERYSSLNYDEEVRYSDFHEND
ncbi:hypothetical protein [Chryseobacterium sp. MA9]|uniref:hypothetical protein n=1 Tax=Chryseobacterium sp. MA9 TaxID=2966625 RepID=UPI00210804B8|nr:hypothetical protein [Chryseobacterium sp. MA9]UTX46667.1 hypothetical protein KIK00_11895 [Chryseobacterium sp. MA9]